MISADDVVVPFLLAGGDPAWRTKPGPPRKPAPKGQRFGRLMVLDDAGPDRWLCACECGRVFAIRKESVRDPRTRSCGCMRTKLIAEAITRMHRRWKIDGKAYSTGELAAMMGLTRGGMWSRIKRKGLARAIEWIPQFAELATRMQREEKPRDAV